MYELFQGARRHARQVNQKLEALWGLLRADQKVGYAADEILIIHSAQYGAKEHTVDVAEVLGSKIISGSIKNFRVNNENLGKDPIPGVHKTLKVDYLYCGENRSISIQEGKLLTIP